MPPRFMYSRIFPVLFFLSAIHQTTFGQGCSDAGFCTMGAMRPNQTFSHKAAVKLRSVEFLQYAGVTKFHDVILTSLVDINIGIGKRGSAQIKLPYTCVSGSLANTSGTADISLAYTHAVLVKDTYQLLGTLGGKLPTNNADKLSSDGRPLPMYYQTSLGTNDLVVGLSFITRKWLLATGYQHAFNQIGNDFRWSEWNSSAQRTEALEYPPSWNLKRGSDVMFRIERNFRSTKWNAYLGLLTIYRITPDQVSKGTSENRVEVPNTTGPAITALSGAGYRFSTAVALKAMVGVKIINRDTNPDGLSREFVSSLSVEIRL
ncbi:hypothetical protein [Cytophaga hutchinsonii]|uniref:Uncharacterized protein n=1 Tax=Cytophaga hutchinsonii (strain ATCC 33406 / DSM 1761 / CIP 103989 / NBRC 15051 / NCIMB 9469 / D465) TaxID=269798 RepID=A0A6N4SMS6_CYTH3|nr:hypothetical protein [Cytophaga hutchinsonii]ABG57573.1 hypothetical protein CHU_0282 [Cytophaga hutchinsonii ATCC 33406]SFX00228.1 hypothetical protein SAMN04487930_101136 [Cytophaga hutchinsonii ATCC 33406]